MYLDDLGDLITLTHPELEMKYQQLLQGDITTMQPITDHWLREVVAIAKGYEEHKVNLEDLIQEGNIGLITGLDFLLGVNKNIDCKEFLKESIQKSMEDYIDSLMDDSDWTKSVIAKATLIEEAKQAFAEEHVKIPDRKSVV